MYYTWYWSGTDINFFFSDLSSRASHSNFHPIWNKYPPVTKFCPLPFPRIYNVLFLRSFYAKSLTCPFEHAGYGFSCLLHLRVPGSRTILNVHPAGMHYFMFVESALHAILTVGCVGFIQVCDTLIRQLLHYSLTDFKSRRYEVLSDVFYGVPFVTFTCTLYFLWRSVDMFYIHWNEMSSSKYSWQFFFKNFCCGMRI